MTINVRINRSHWVRATLPQVHGQSALLMDKVGATGRPSEAKCCLGFVAEACGLKPAEIRGKSDFSSLNTFSLVRIPAALRPDEPKHYEWDGTALALHDYLVNVNDAGTATLKRLGLDREAEIVKGLADAGITCTFVGGRKGRKAPVDGLVGGRG